MVSKQDVFISLFIIVIFSVAIIISVFLSFPRAEYIPENRQLKVDDIPLMTENEKAYARATGCATYEVDGVYYVDWSLDKSFYM